MATTTRASSFLPSIKCSSCSVEIPISQMGDHICYGASPDPDVQLKTVDPTFAPPAPPPQNPLPLPPTRKPLPWSDTPTSFNVQESGSQVTNRNSEQSEKPAPPPNPPFNFPGSVSSSRSASPVMPATGYNSRFKMPPRSRTAPLKPPSPDLSISQDCAFPPFLSSKSRSPTPTNPVEIRPSFPHEESNRGTNEWDSAYAPRSPGSLGGGAVLKRMDSIAPGPFTMKDKGERWKPGHQKSPSMSRSQDFTSRRSSQSSKSHMTRLSTASSNYTRNRSVSNASGTSRSFLDLTDVPAVPSLPAASITSERSSHTSNIPEKSTAAPFDFGPLSHERRSMTFPQDAPPSKGDQEGNSGNNRPSGSSVYSHRPRPSVAAAMQPLNEIGSTKSFKTSRSLRGRPTAKASEKPAIENPETGSRADSRLDDAPPVPKPVETQGSPTNPYHTPHESTSSNDSYGSGFKGGSSRSSPPLDMSPIKSHAQGSSDKGSLDNRFEGFNFNVENRSQPEEPPSHEPQPAISQASNPTKPSLSLPDNPPLKLQPNITTTTPLNIPTRKDSNPITSPEDYTFSSSTPKSNNLRLTPLPPQPAPPPQTQTSPARKSPPTAPSKGKCRGCQNPIIGKSVSSADGRLTGRYHKACFVCKTCASPFPSAEFYITNNNPYCARHYHELNNSLCTSCDRGIEGQYLETAATPGKEARKFHSHCFSCQDCHRILRDDYYEWGGKALCEQHAFSRAGLVGVGGQGGGTGQTSLLGPGRKFPERRTTKLMMM